MTFRKNNGISSHRQSIDANLFLDERKQFQFFDLQKSQWQISPIRGFASGSNSVKNIVQPSQLKQIKNQSRINSRQQNRFNFNQNLECKGARDYQIKKNPEEKRFFDDEEKDYQTLLQKYQELERYCGNLVKENSKLKSQMVKYQENRNQELSQKEDECRQLCIKNQELKNYIAQIERRSQTFLQTSNSHSYNSFYVEELERKNEQLRRQNKRYGDIVMKKLKNSLER